jgi:hypothetical protein
MEIIYLSNLLRSMGRYQADYTLFFESNMVRITWANPVRQRAWPALLVSATTPTAAACACFGSPRSFGSSTCTLAHPLVKGAGLAKFRPLQPDLRADSDEGS